MVVLLVTALIVCCAVALSIVERQSLVSLAFIAPFLAVIVLRTAALANVATMPAPSSRLHWHNGIPRARTTPEVLPTYAVLVALYDEAHVVPGLVEALGALDYPADRLAIRFVVEADDEATYRALASFALPACMGVIVVPDGKPRTKPRALNYALTQTPGAIVVVYDAEDQPEPDQLRRALAAFRASPDTVCQQAALNVTNYSQSWLSRQFAIEYSALFDVLLPTYRRLGLPMPLGGTSNHFRREALEAVLAWDPHNVTEDADLGIRLARFGMKVGVFSSTTWEEAPATFAVWLRQRTRWLKGWMTTWLVHMRRPSRLIREIGVWPFAGFQLMLASMILSALVHPWFYVYVGADVVRHGGFGPFLDGGLNWLDWLALINLVGGYVSAMVLGAVAVVRRGRPGIAWAVLLMPIYWLCISLAAYRALIQLVRAPHHWEKTPHLARPARGQPDSGR
ncbi:MAG: glycosyltransferase [Hyphomicrobiaceae bacterium]|nr:glycosyltransferase [Hyphomicrobiaceae bacterium]